MVVRVRVKPNSRRQALERQPDGSYVARLNAPPVEGRANEELIALVAREFGIPKSQVRIRTGLASRTKLVEVAL